jgi:PQQ-dependent catabolism-associated CXXCW motif protein
MLIAPLMLLVASSVAGELPPEPSGYRLDDYRTTTPATVFGRKAVTTDEATRARDSGAVFIDVMPAPHRPAGMPAGAIWAPRPRLSIPGSVWLPDVGHGALNPELERWFRGKLEQLAKGDAGAALVFFCLADCWMSWNAARRALEWGYSGTQWYSEGTDGWRNAGLPLEEVTPAPDAPR